MKIAIITGASSGMGKWFAVYASLFYPELEEIWLVGRNIKRLYKTSKYIKVHTRLFSLDLTNSDELSVLFDTIKEEKPEIRLLVNSAGLGYIGRFDKISCAENLEMIDLNCKVLTAVCHNAIPFMGKDSHIINLASAAAFSCQSNFAVYAASKSYVLSFSDGISKELKPKGIYVTAVCPGSVDTPFFDTAEKHEKRKSFKRYFMAKDKYVVFKAYWDSKARKSRSIYGAFIKLFYIAAKILPHRILKIFV